MKPERIFRQGRTDLPLVVLIHGMGMEMRIWSDPTNVKILAGSYPLSSIMDERYGHMQTLYHDLSEEGYRLLAWSQQRPVGPISSAVSELRRLIAEFREFMNSGTILIGHSRGGLIARKYLENPAAPVRGLITIATPHRGTTLAGWARYLGPLASALDGIAALGGRSERAIALRRIAGFLRSAGLRELLPDSRLISGLPDKIECRCLFSIGGTNPDLIRIGGISLLDLLARLIPDRAVPDEIKHGLGDGLVSAASARPAYASEHRDFQLNHVSLLFDPVVRSCVMDWIKLVS